MITVSLTTIKEREESLKETIASLIDQVDKINVYLHGYKDIPLYLFEEKIEVKKGEDNGDLDKFHWIKETTGWHFIVDDDLIFPETYIQESISFVKRNGIEHVYSYHGAINYSLPIISYYSDRVVYPCLDEVKEKIEVNLLGTGVLVYYTEKPFDFDYNGLPINMADIHFAIFLQELGKKKYVIPHKKGYIQHSQKVELENTIYEKNKNSDFLQTQFINDNPKTFNVERQIPNFPLVSVVVVNSRQLTHRDKVKRCFDSIRNQIYPKLEVIKVNNVERLVSIGKCFNDGIKASKGDLILFVGDDDWISADYIHSLVDTLLRNPDPKSVGVTSYLTIFNDSNEFEHAKLVPTGMWYKEWLIDHPFKEYLTKYVDTELFEETKNLGYNVKIAGNQYGYYYNSHDGQISGNKKLYQDYSKTEENQTRISDILKNIKEY